MAIKDLLLHVDSSEQCEQRVREALRLAERDDAHITGLFTYQTFVYPVYAEMGGSAYIYNEIENRNQELAEEARKKFDDWTQSRKSRISWIVREGDAASTLSNYAAHHDLVVVGQTSPGINHGADQAMLNRFLIESPRPALVIPGTGAKEKFGSRILVAWNSSNEASRAVHDALPFLLEAEEVEVTSINTEKGVDIPCVDIVEHLSRHGVNVQGGNADTKSRNTGEAILYLAQSFGADMIVMGAYGHSRLREYILGGATRHVLEKTTIPVLLSH